MPLRLFKNPGFHILSLREYFSAGSGLMITGGFAFLSETISSDNNYPGFQNNQDFAFVKVCFGVLWSDPKGWKGNGTWWLSCK